MSLVINFTNGILINIIISYEKLFKLVIDDLPNVL